MFRNVDYIDFGVDQLDIKKAMKPKLGPDVVLRLRFGQPSAGTAIGGKGYAMIQNGEETSLEMVQVTERTNNFRPDESAQSEL
jgi:hypothetical protein